jgi:hypothetical protein
VALLQGKIAQTAADLTYIHEVPVSNLSRNIDSPDWDNFSFPQSLQPNTGTGKSKVAPVLN